MAKVKVDVLKGQREFDVVTLSDVNAVKGLLLYRSKLDIYNDHLEDKDILEPSSWFSVNNAVICLYADLDMLIDKCGLQQGQKALLELIRSGFTTEDVAEYMGVDERSLNRSFNKICKRIVEYHNTQWLAWAHLNYVKCEWKTCRACGESYPKSDRFFYKHSISADGFRHNCIQCYGFTQKVAEYDSQTTYSLREGMYL